MPPTIQLELGDLALSPPKETISPVNQAVFTPVVESVNEDALNSDNSRLITDGTPSMYLSNENLRPTYSVLKRVPAQKEEKPRHNFFKRDYVPMKQATIGFGLD